MSRVNYPGRCPGPRWGQAPRPPGVSFTHMYTDITCRNSIQPMGTRGSGMYVYVCAYIEKTEKSRNFRDMEKQGVQTLIYQ